MEFFQFVKLVNWGKTKRIFGFGDTEQLQVVELKLIFD